MAPPKSTPQSKKRSPSSSKSVLHTPALSSPTQAGLPILSPQEDAILPNPASTPPAAQQAVLAALPMVSPPSSAPQVAFGNLNSQDAVFYIQSDSTVLRTIVQNAPATVRRSMPPNASHDTLLNEVFRLRQQEALQPQESAKSNQHALKSMIGMSTQQLLDISQSNPQKLKQLMHAALLADATLWPRNFPLDGDSKLAEIAIGWQLQSHRQAHAFQQARYTPSIDLHSASTRRVHFAPTVSPTDALPTDSSRFFPSHPPAAVPCLAHMLAPPQPKPPTLAFSDDSSEDDFDNVDRGSKRQRPATGTPGFTTGVGALAPKLPKQYPGKGISSTSLNIRERYGKKILATWISGGSDLPTFLARFNWRRSQAGFPSQAEIEARTLGRAVHLEMLTCRTPKEALQTRPSLEVLLRRLYAILFVEEGMNSRKYSDKSIAWNNIDFILETHPTRSIMCDDITDEVGKKIAFERKRISAVKALEQSRAAARRKTARPELSCTPPPTPSRKHTYKR